MITFFRRSTVNTDTQIVAGTLVVGASDSVDNGRADYVCDGTADDVQINQAIADASGGRVILLEGTYNISATIDLDIADTVLEGQGWETILQAVTNLNDQVVLFTADRCEVKNLKVDNITNIQGTVIDCVQFLNADDCLIDRCFIWGGISGNENLINIDNADRTVVSNNLLIVAYATGSYDHIIDIDGGARGVRILDNYIDASQDTTQAIRGICIEEADYCIISRNIMDGSSPDTVEGIEIKSTVGNDHNNISANNLWGWTTSITIVGANATRNLVDGNNCDSGITDNGTNSVIGDNVVA